MDELDRGLRIALAGPEAEAPLAELREQMRRWGLKMPAVEPLVIDFGLGRFRQIGEIEHWIANEADAGYCGKFLFVLDGQTCPRHHHRDKHETFFVVKGKVRMDLDGKVTVMKSGDVLSVEPGRTHEFAGIGPALLLEVSKPCRIDDNYFEDADIPIGGNSRKRS